MRFGTNARSGGKEGRREMREETGGEGGGRRERRGKNGEKGEGREGRRGVKKQDCEIDSRGGLHLWNTNHGDPAAVGPPQNPRVLQ